VDLFFRAGRLVAKNVIEKFQQIFLRGEYGPRHAGGSRGAFLFIAKLKSFCGRAEIFMKSRFEKSPPH